MISVKLKCLSYHFRAQMAAANANVYNICNCFPGKPFV